MLDVGYKNIVSGSHFVLPVRRKEDEGFLVLELRRGDGTVVVRHLVNARNTEDGGLLLHGMGVW